MSLLLLALGWTGQLYSSPSAFPQPTGGFVSAPQAPRPLKLGDRNPVGPSGSHSLRRRRPENDSSTGPLRATARPHARPPVKSELPCRLVGTLRANGLALAIFHQPAGEKANYLLKRQETWIEGLQIGGVDPSGLWFRRPAPHPTLPSSLSRCSVGDAFPPGAKPSARHFLSPTTFEKVRSPQSHWMQLQGVPLSVVLQALNECGYALTPLDRLPETLSPKLYGQFQQEELDDPEADSFISTLKTRLRLADLDSPFATSLSHTGDEASLGNGHFHWGTDAQTGGPSPSLKARSDSKAELHWLRMPFLHQELGAIRTQLERDLKILLSPKGKLFFSFQQNRLEILDRPEFLHQAYERLVQLDQPATPFRLQLWFVATSQATFRSIGSDPTGVSLTPSDRESFESFSPSDLLNAPSGLIKQALGFGRRFLERELSALEAQGEAVTLAAPSLLITPQTPTSFSFGHSTPTSNQPVRTRKSERSTQGSTATPDLDPGGLQLELTAQPLHHESVLLKTQLRHTFLRGCTEDPDSRAKSSGKQELSTVAKLNLGEVTLLSSLVEGSNWDRRRGWPTLNKIPLIRWLTSRTKLGEQHQVLLIFACLEPVSP